MRALHGRVVVFERDARAELRGATLEQSAVREADELAIEPLACDGQAEFRPDAGRLAGAERDSQGLQSL